MWKDHFVTLMRPIAGEVIVDVAGGTGDIALRCAQKTDGKGKITVCDINPAMLRVGQNKAIDHGWLNDIQWTLGNAEALPFQTNSVDLLSIAFGLRNVTRIDDALAEFFRILKPGGRFFCMEFSPTPIKPLKKIYELYSFTVLPWLGEKVAHDRESYQYLAESIRQFPVPDALAARMKKAGFECVRWHALLGGIAVIHSGWKL